MKIVMINAIVKGSTGKIMLQSAEVARNNGFEVYTVSSVRASQPPKEKKHFFLDKKFEYIVCQTVGKVLGNALMFTCFPTLRLIRLLKRIKPDVIHLHIIHGYYLDYAMLFKYIKKHNIRVIWTLHDCWSFTGRCPYFQLIECEKWLTGCGRCQYPRDMYPASILREGSHWNWKRKKKHFTGVKDLTLVTPSHWLAELVKRSFLREYPIKVIHNGIDLEIFAPSKSDFRERYRVVDKYILLGVANAWDFRKGLDVFVELAKRLGDRFQIVLVGTNDKIDKQLPDSIISIHRTYDQKELAQIYTAADLFVNPTREEVLGLVNIEALACGTPVVTFRTGGSPECIDESCGSVVDCDDVDALYNEIMRIQKEKPFRKENCIKHAKAFDKYKKFAQYVDLYK